MFFSVPPTTTVVAINYKAYKIDSDNLVSISDIVKANIFSSTKF